MNSFHLSCTVFRYYHPKSTSTIHPRPEEGRKTRKGGRNHPGLQFRKKMPLIQEFSEQKNEQKKQHHSQNIQQNPKPTNARVFSFQVALRIPAFGMLPSKICRSVVAVPAAVTAAWTQLALAKSAAFFGKSMKSPKESMKSRTIL